MADKKVSELTALTTPNQKDLILIVDDPSGTPVSKRITLKSLFGSVPANTVINGTLTVNANITLNGNKATVVANTTFSKTAAGQVKINSGVVTLGKKTTVNSNNASTLLGASNLQGSIFWDENFLYVATANTKIKRVSLSHFNS